MHIQILLRRVLPCWCLLLAGPGLAQTMFTEVTQKAGILRGGGRAALIGDYDHDGWPDLFRPGSGDGQVALFHNQGNGNFADQTAMVIQSELTPKFKGGGSIFGDYDNDGDLDLLVAVGAYVSEQAGQNILLRNDQGVFHDVALAAGLIDSLSTDNALWLDYDRDGYLDLYLGNPGCGQPEQPVFNLLYRNRGDGSFEEVTEQVGLRLQLGSTGEAGGCPGGSNGGMAAGDFNDDGWPDLYLAVFKAPNRLFLNDGHGHFVDATTEGIADPGEAFGVAVGDIDNDGDLDIFQASGGNNDLGLPYRSPLFLNLGQGRFRDFTDAVGLGGLYGQNILIATLGDVDNDGDLDLITGSPHFLYLNNGDGTFVDQTVQSGMTDNLVAPFGLGDYDLDGFLDAWDGKRLYHNGGNDNHYLRVELVGVRSNRSGIGARVLATAGELRQMREVLGGYGLNQDELVAHFGLGQRTQVDRLEIRWPSGQVDVLTDIPADQKIRVIEGRQGYRAIHPIAWETSDSLVVGATGNFEIAVHPALFEEGSQIEEITVDLSALGGSAAVPLADAGEGSYRLNTALKMEENGLRRVAVFIEQNTFLGPYWTRLSRQVTVVPGEDLVVFDEALAPDWQTEGNRRIKKLDLSEVGVVQRGSVAGAFEGDGGRSPWGITFKPLKPVNPVGYTALHLAFHPGEARPPDPVRFTVTLEAGTGKELLGSAGLDLSQKRWQEVEIPLDAFQRSGDITAITFAGNFAGTFYLDDIRLVAATPPAITVVAEEHTTALPQSFTLAQNFPNPFNSDTVTRFALPESGAVELAVYNLAGQRVAMLVSGTREAGTYAVNWDGRDEQGRELASGVYLYRLRVGEREEMRKLALVR